MRRHANDLEYLYALLNFINKLGLLSSPAHALVMSQPVQELWRRITNKLIHNQKSNFNEAVAAKTSSSIFSIDSILGLTNNNKK